jgi:hypothetical protein
MQASRVASAQRAVSLLKESINLENIASRREASMTSGKTISGILMPIPGLGIFPRDIIIASACPQINICQVPGILSFKGTFNWLVYFSNRKIKNNE